LNAKLYELTDDHTDGAYQPGKIYFAKNAGIGNKGIGSSGKAGGKIAPDNDATHLEQHGVHTIGRYFGHYIKQQKADSRGEYGLYKMP
jgi:hypothetical protein